MTECPLNTKAIREKATEVMFEKFQVPGFHILVMRLHHYIHGEDYQCYIRCWSYMYCNCAMFRKDMRCRMLY